MALITKPPAPPELPLDQLVRGKISQINLAYGSVLDIFATQAAFVWANPKYSPQEVFDSYGKDAVDLCRLSAAFAGMVYAYTGQNVSPVPPGFSVQFNEDGTVTVVPDKPPT